MPNMEEITQSGPIRDERGRWLPGQLPPGAAPPITSANAREMLKRRTEIYRRAAFKRVTTEMAAIDADVDSPMDAWAFIVAKQAVALVDSDKPRLLDTKILGQLLGAVAKDEQDGGNGPALTLSTEGAAIVNKLLDLVKQSRT